MSEMNQLWYPKYSCILQLSFDSQPIPWHLINLFAHTDADPWHLTASVSDTGRDFKVSLRLGWMYTLHGELYNKQSQQFQLFIISIIFSQAQYSVIIFSNI